ncbi:hypothetical protein Tco_1124803 [Tanacetum coccineum]|uniref:Uncharacterized protein n=1 Tax=Tanacetum coccineum TaxID=301880 RepID=A0ABQ5JA70_9ASTR
MTSPMIDLIYRTDSPNEHLPLPAIATATATKTIGGSGTSQLSPGGKDGQTWVGLYKSENLDIPHQDRFRDLPEADMKEILHHRMWETNSYKAYEDHKKLYEALENSMDRNHSDQLLTDLAEARRKKKKRHDSPRTLPGSPPYQPPPAPPPAGPYGTSGAFETSRSSQLPPPPPPPSTNLSDQSKSTAAPSSSKITTSAEYTTWTTTDTRLKPSVSSIPENLYMDDDLAPDEQYQMEECHKLLTDKVNDAIIRYNVSKPLPLGGQPGQVTIQAHFFFNKDLEYLIYGSKGGRHALSISKMKAACYPDVGLEQMLFQRQRFYIDRHTSEGDRKAVRTHMRILSVVRIKVFSLYGYDYMKTIVLRRADLNNNYLLKRDFKYLYLSDFEYLYLLNLQGHLNHLPPKDKQILSTAVNLWIKNLFKHDFTVIDSPRAVTFRDKYGVQMIMRFNEIHKFMNGTRTLQQIDEALDYQVKEFKVKRMNPGLNIRFWTRKDVGRSKEFMFSIQKRLKTRRIFRNLESIFV